jgi:sulfatase maturation enzyme AslB (radical SAM superfamily)
MALVLSAVFNNMRDRPINLEFAVTEKCNSRCVMCDQWRQPSREELSLAEIEKIFRSYDGFRIVGLTGGEPTLRKDLPEIAWSILLTQKHLKRLFLTTNGLNTAAAVDAVERILLAVPRWVRFTTLVSVDGPPVLHEKIRGIPGGYGKTLNTIKALAAIPRQKNFKVGVLTTYGPFNFQNYGLVLTELADLTGRFDLESGICVVWTGNLYRNAGASWQTPAYLSDLHRWVPKMKRAIKVGLGHDLLEGRGLFFDLAARFARDPSRQVIPCSGARTRFFMNAQGHVFPCVVWDAQVADLRQCGYDLKAAFSCSEKKRIRRLVETSKCPICCVGCELIPSMMAHPAKMLWKVLV